MNRLATLPALLRPFAGASVSVHAPEPMPWPEPLSPDLPGEPFPDDDVPLPLDPLDAPPRTPAELPEIEDPYRPGEQIPLHVQAAAVVW